MSGREYFVIPAGGANIVDATSPFNAAKKAREEHPELRDRPITVVPLSRTWRFERTRWRK